MRYQFYSSETDPTWFMLLVALSDSMVSPLMTDSKTESSSLVLL